MASTNEDVVVLATAALEDGRRLLVVRHLPDRGTVEIGWWDREESGGVAPRPPVLELVAEAVEGNAVAELCERLAGAECVSAARAQDIEPCSFYNAPVGVNFLISGYASG